MARAIQQIKQELENISEKVAQLKEKTYSLYSQYIELLEQAIIKQFIIAAYQLCTQIYPEAFLKLSYSEREELQQNLRKISQENFQEFRENLALNEDLKITTPLELAQWHEYLEDAIITEIDAISKLGNSCLQKAGILPAEIPVQVLEMAIDAEENTQGISSPANLLYLLVETDQDETETQENISKLAVVRLRRSELEFSNSNLTTQRSKIREMGEEIGKLEQKCERHTKELAIAEAEAAWRSSWHL